MHAHESRAKKSPAGLDGDEILPAVDTVVLKRSRALGFTCYGALNPLALG